MYVSYRGTCEPFLYTMSTVQSTIGIVLFANFCLTSSGKSIGGCQAL